MNPLERELERALVVWAKDHGWLALKFTPHGDRGWPDRIFVKRGTHVWLELKRRGETPNPLQMHRRAKLMKHGAIVHWTDNMEEAKRLLNQYDKELQRPLKDRLK